MAFFGLLMYSEVETIRYSGVAIKDSVMTLSGRQVFVVVR